MTLSFHTELGALFLLVAALSSACASRKAPAFAFPNAALCPDCAGLMVASSLDREVAPRTFKEYYCLDERLVYLRQDGEFPTPRALEQVLFESRVEPGVHRLEAGLVVGYEAGGSQEPSLVIQNRELVVEANTISQVMVVVRPDKSGSAVVESMDGHAEPASSAPELALRLGQPDPITLALPPPAALAAGATREEVLDWARAVAVDMHAMLEALAPEVERFHTQRPSLGAAGCVDDQMDVMRQLTTTADRALAGMKHPDMAADVLAREQYRLQALQERAHGRLDVLATCGAVLPEPPCRPAGGRAR